MAQPTTRLGHAARYLWSLLDSYRAGSSCFREILSDVDSLLDILEEEIGASGVEDVRAEWGALEAIRTKVSDRGCEALDAVDLQHIVVAVYRLMDLTRSLSPEDIDDAVPAEQIAVHREPAWGERSNFMVMAQIEGENLPRNWEQLWARQVGQGRLETCCIPFFIYDLALGDVVECVAMGPMEYAIGQVLEPSGHWTFRAYFGDTTAPESLLDVDSTLRERGHELEWWAAELLAVDAVGPDEAHRVADYLRACQERGELIYESGKRARN